MPCCAACALARLAAHLPSPPAQSRSAASNPPLCIWPFRRRHIYGFVIEKERPLLAAIDLPGYSQEDPFQQTPPDDSAYDRERGVGRREGRAGMHCSTAVRKEKKAGLLWR